MTTTAYMLIVLPNVGASTDVWGTELNTALQAIIDPHDHTTGKGKQVPTAGIGINADLDMSAWRLMTVCGVDFDNLGATLTTGACEAFVAFGDLYYRNNTGTNIRITNGGALNMTTVGGIAGNYTSAGAEVAFVDAQDGYTFKQQTGAAVRQYAKMDCADVRLYEFKAHPAAAPPTNFVSLKSPAALAASYQVTMPAAVPASTLPVQMSAAGVLSVGGSIAMASGDNITLSGAGRYKRSGGTFCVALSAGLTSGANVAYDSTNHYLASTGAGTYTLNVPIPDNRKVTQIDTEVYGNGACLISVDAFKLEAAGLYYTATSSSTPGAAYATQTINNATLAANWTGSGAQTFTGYQTLEFKITFGAAGGRVSRIKVTFDDA